MKRSHNAGRRVLIVDDDRDTREMYGESLRAMGFDVMTAASAEEALRRAAQLAPAVLVTDLRLRGHMDGFELARRLREDARTRATRIIMLTGAAFGAERELAEASGCDRFLLKPCLPDALAAEIRRLANTGADLATDIGAQTRVHDSRTRRSVPRKT
jgi:CheY-like chemotaxis protein